ncbi:hypothetical protein BH23PLA1_BH23PLA1_25540 [soil metagenome]
MEERELPLEDLVLDPNLNLRDRLDPETVERYAESWNQMPPVTVFEVDGHWLLADGFHRHAAAASSDRRTIRAEVRCGTFAEALEFASGANLGHGLPLTRPERRRAVEVKLRLHHDWSDRRLADDLGVGRELVGRVRKQLVEAGQVPAIEGRLGADGKIYPSAGWPKDPNEQRPGGPALAQQDDPRDRGKRESDPAPWDDAVHPLPTVNEPPPPPWEASGTDPKALARAGPVGVAEPTINEMLAIMTRQVLEVVSWIEAEGFDEAYQAASERSRAQLREAIGTLSARVEAL